MTIIVPQTTTLEEFLRLPYIDESPAWEYLNKEAIQKPMGGGKHSLLQKRLIAAIDGVDRNYEAFPELRCSVGNRSVVLDVVVVESNQLPIDENGDIIVVIYCIKNQLIFHLSNRGCVATMFRENILDTLPIVV